MQSPKIASRRFTLLELLAVICVILILLSLIAFGAKGVKKSREVRCLSNLKQVGVATLLYLSNNRTQYPGHLTSIDHQGRTWMGKKGNGDSRWLKNVTERPLNVYMGYTSDNIETPGVKCPFNDDDIDVYNKVGSSYSGNAYDYWNSLESKRIGQVKSPSTAALATEFGAFAFLLNDNSNYWRMTHAPKKLLYPIARLDGSSILHLLTPGEGMTIASKTVNFNLSLEP